MIEIIDNFLSPEDFEKIRYHIVDDPNMMWSYRKEILPENYLECDSIENHMYAFTFCANGKKSTNFDIVIPLLKNLNCRYINRVKANSTWARNKNIKIGWHTDVSLEYAKKNNSKTAIYYLNTNDGCTIIKDDKCKEIVVNCIENRVVIFDAWLQHVGVTCTSPKRKLLINLNYY